MGKKMLVSKANSIIKNTVEFMKNVNFLFPPLCCLAPRPLGTDCGHVKCFYSANNGRQDARRWHRRKLV